MKNIIRLLVFSIALTWLTGCEDEVTSFSYDTTRISMIVADNANLSKLNEANKRTEIYDLLLEEGPFTLLAPSDDAFGSLNVNSTGLTRLTRIMEYHVLNGRYDFHKIPFQFNQEVRSHTGGKMFVTRWIKDVDTVITINGAIVTPIQKDASNGKIQVINRLLEPYLFDYLSDAVNNEYELTLFNHILQRLPEVKRLLAQPGAYTVYAPTNTAMTSYGLSTLEIINERPIEELEKIARYHIVPDRRFVYDYILTTPTKGNPSKVTTMETMLGGDNLSVNLIFNSGKRVYDKITLTAVRSTKDTNLTRENILAGNGVLHIIDNVLLN